jgi:16S rRNA (uracil1498-N3)-methyltransferase
VVEVFDNVGHVASGELTVSPSEVSVCVTAVQEVPSRSLELFIAAAVPKGERADWMVEKLSELGVAEFIPLAAERSVVLPEGKNKRERWQRIATESAKQSRRAGVMRIGELTRVDDVLRRIGGRTAGCYFSTERDAMPISHFNSQVSESLIALIGPEGGWSESELTRFAEARLTAVKLSATVLRVETAAIAAAAIIECTFDA